MDTEEEPPIVVDGEVWAFPIFRMRRWRSGVIYRFEVEAVSQNRGIHRCFYVDYQYEWFGQNRVSLTSTKAVVAHTRKAVGEWLHDNRMNTVWSECDEPNHLIFPPIPDDPGKGS